MQRDGGPGGAGGAGGTHGTSFTGGSQALEIIRDHCFAYSGIVVTAGSQSAATTTTLSFTSGNYYAKVRLTFSNNNTSTTANLYYLINMNGVTVYKAENEHGSSVASNQRNPTLIHLIIPPYTEVETLVGSSADPMNTTTIISGRVYRG